MWRPSLKTSKCNTNKKADKQVNQTHNTENNIYMNNSNLIPSVTYTVSHKGKPAIGVLLAGLAPAIILKFITNNYPTINRIMMYD